MSVAQKELEAAESAQPFELHDTSPSLSIGSNSEDVLSPLRPLGNHRRGQLTVGSGAPPEPSKGTLHIGGLPSASSRTSLTKEDDVTVTLARLAGEIAQLRSEARAEKSSVDPQTENRLHRDVTTIKDAIEQLEAFVSITLVEKLDQIVGEKLTVIHKTEASNRRLSRWLRVFIGLSLALAGIVIWEALTDNMASMLEALGTWGAALIEQVQDLEIYTWPGNAEGGHR